MLATMFLALTEALLTTTPDVQVVAKIHNTSSIVSLVSGFEDSSLDLNDVYVSKEDSSKTNEILIDTPININTADVELLQKLKNIGVKRAQAIVDYREKNGIFQKIEDIMNVSGIGEKIFESIKDNITV